MCSKQSAGQWRLARPQKVLSARPSSGGRHGRAQGSSGPHVWEVASQPLHRPCRPVQTHASPAPPTLDLPIASVLPIFIPLVHHHHLYAHALCLSSSRLVFFPSAIPRALSLSHSRTIGVCALIRTPTPASATRVAPASNLPWRSPSFDT